MDLLNNIEILNEELSASDQLGLPSQKKSSLMSSLLKGLYDSSVTESTIKVGPFDELIVNDLDTESIWEEINSRNKPLTRNLTNRIAKLYKSTEQVKEDVVIKSSKKSAKYDSEDNETSSGSESGDNDEDASGSDNEDNFDEEHDEDQEYDSNEDNEDAEGSQEEGDDGDDYEEDVDMDTWLDRTEKQEEQHYLKLQRKEKKDAHKGAAESDEESNSDADDMEFVQNQMYDEGEDEEGGGEYHFKDFFVGAPKEAGSGKDKAKGKGKGRDGKFAPKKVAAGVNKSSAKKTKSSKKDINHDSEDDEDEEEEEEEGDDSEQDDFDGMEDEDDEEDEEHGAFDEDDDEGDEDDFNQRDENDDYVESGSENEAPIAVKVIAPKKPLTKHEKQKAQLSSQVAELEQELMQKKSWEMRGEVKASERPENSLLGISADIERSSKPAPVISEEYTTSLEDLILKRINESRFDDVKPKVERESRNTAGGVDDGPELSQEKNRQGLGEVYAEEFLAKSLNSQPEVVSKKLDAARQEAFGLYHKISMQLDGLSHFYFTPRAVVADAAITTMSTKTALSSLELEDILPGMESSASQFAPGQVLEKRKGRDASLMSREELTSDDRKRLRNARKHAGKDESESEDEKKGKAGRKQQRAKDDKRLDDELGRDKRVTLNNKSSKNGGGTNGDENQNGEYSKSASFFEKLQQNAQSEISGANKGEKKSKKKVVVNGSGSSYKL